jgi:hypothetical protein
MKELTQKQIDDIAKQQVPNQRERREMPVGESWPWPTPKPMFEAIKDKKKTKR